MSNSSLVTYTKISPNRTSPRNHKIDTITIHCVVGQFTAREILNLRHFATYDSRAGASCNYAIGRDGSVGLCVEEKDRSWCSSSSSNDHRAITIECASDRTAPYAINDVVYKKLIELLVDICERNDIRELKWKADKSLIGNVDLQNMTVHRWFAKKDCPGEYIYSRLGKIAEEVNKKVKMGSIVNKSQTYSLKDFVMDVQRSLGATVDGIAGPETLGETLTISSKLNNKHPVVRFIQLRLNVLGYTEVGKADGIAGIKFTSAVKHFQQDHGCHVDGEVTARAKTWKELLGMR